jgi:hypothetical protein
VSRACVVRRAVASVTHCWLADAWCPACVRGVHKWRSLQATLVVWYSCVLQCGQVTQGRLYCVLLVRLKIGAGSMQHLASKDVAKVFLRLVVPSLFSITR